MERILLIFINKLIRNYVYVQFRKIVTRTHHFTRNFPIIEKMNRYQYCEYIQNFQICIF